jgi:hypothetical protein
MSTATATKRPKINIPSAPSTPALTQATASATPKVSAMPLTGLAAMLALVKKGGAAETTKKSKKGTPELDVPPEIIDDLRIFIAADCRKKTAEGELKAERAPIEPVLLQKFIDKVRADGTYFKTVSIGDDVCKGGLINFSFGRLMLEKPSEARPLEAIDAELRELLGDSFDKYVKPCMALSIKPSALEGHARTMQTLQLLQEKLGDAFGELFDFQASLDLHTMAMGSDSTVEFLTKDYVTDPVFMEKLKPALKKGLVNHGWITFKSSQGAIAAAGEDQAKDMELLIAAKAAMAASGALAAAGQSAQH